MSRNGENFLKKQQVLQFREQGYSYGAIAHYLNMSRSSVQYICESAKNGPEGSVYDLLPRR